MSRVRLKATASMRAISGALASARSLACRSRSALAFSAAKPSLVEVGALRMKVPNSLGMIWLESSASSTHHNAISESSLRAGAFSFSLERVTKRNSS